MLIYCSHRYGGEERNRDAVAEKILELQMCDPENTYISPIHCFGFMYDTLDYDDGMACCLDLLSVCDELLVLSDESEGVRREIAFAKKRGIEVRYDRAD